MGKDNKETKLILFQGDSITDSGRRLRDADAFLGSGYAALVTAELSYSYPGKYDFINRAVSGERIVDIYVRIKKDIINLKPDYMSILVGVNDVLADLQNNNGISAGKYEKIYNMLLDEVKQALPELKIIVFGSYVLNTGERADGVDYSILRAEVAKRAAAANRVANMHGACFVPLQPVFDEAAEKTSAELWTPDGVHPSYAGHELIKKEWLKAFKNL